MTAPTFSVKSAPYCRLNSSSVRSCSASKISWSLRPPGNVTVLVHDGIRQDLYARSTGRDDCPRWYNAYSKLLSDLPSGTPVNSAHPRPSDSAGRMYAHVLRLWRPASAMMTKFRPSPTNVSGCAADRH